MNLTLFLALCAMSFLWVGSQIPLYLFGSVLPRIYSDIGGADRYVWFVIGYLIPNAALCPFVGALSDIFGRRYVGMLGQVLLILGPIITTTAHTMNIAIGNSTLSSIVCCLTLSSWPSLFRPRSWLERTHRPRRHCRNGACPQARHLRRHDRLHHSSLLPIRHVGPTHHPRQWLAL